MTMDRFDTRMAYIKDVTRWCKYKNDDEYNHAWRNTGLEGMFVCNSCGAIVELYYYPPKNE